MQPVPLDRLPLHGRDRGFCRRAGLSDAGQIVCKPRSDVDRALSRFVDPDGIARIHRAAVLEQAPALVSALDILRGSNKDFASISHVQHDAQGNVKDVCCSTGDDAVDGLLGGGIRVGALTEVVGQSSTGKTQLMLQTAIFTALALNTSIRPQVGQRTGEGRQNEKSDIVDAIHGYGILPRSRRKTVAIINLDGHGEAQMLLRRMAEMCDALIEERWSAAGEDRKTGLRKEHDRSSAAYNAALRKRKGAFAHSESRRYSLVEAQQLAREQLFANIRLATPPTYGLLARFVTQELPLLMQSLACSSQPDLGLVIIDDLTNIIQEAAEALANRPSESVIMRSRLCCELSDDLKRLATLRVYAVSDEATNKPGPAILVVNHVTNILDRHKELLRPLIELDIKHHQGAAQRDNHASGISQSGVAATPPGQETGCSLPFQELQFGGINAHVSKEVLRFHQAQMQHPSAKRGEIVDGLLSSLRMSSLGLSWINCINVRIVLTLTTSTTSLPAKQRRRLGRHALKNTHMFGVRRAVSVLNPFAPAGQGANPSVAYIICPSGLHSLRTLALETDSGETMHPESHGVADQQNDEDSLWSSVGDEPALDEMEWAAIVEGGIGGSGRPSLSKRARLSQ